MTRKSALGTLLRETRQRKDLTQEQVAARMREHGLGTTGNYWGKLESGFAVPSRETMRVISDVLDIPIGRLYEAAGMLEGVLRPRADQGDGDWLDVAVERLREDPAFAESYRLMLEQQAPPEVRAAQIQALVSSWIATLQVLVVGLKE